MGDLLLPGFAPKRGGTLAAVVVRKAELAIVTKMQYRRKTATTGVSLRTIAITLGT